MRNAPPTTLLQFDFPFAGPWGAELGTAMHELALDIAGEDGLLWKIWTENRAAGRAGGIYLFDDPTSAERYRTRHTARLQAFGVEGIVAHSFAVNAALTHTTRGPLP